MEKKGTVMTLNILGTEYEIRKLKYKDEPYFEKQSVDGYCDGVLHQIVYCDMTTFPGCADESADRCAMCERETLRHEIVHAFMNESGLKDSSFTVDCPWAKNEEMIDWMAIQGPKIYKAWADVGAL